MGELSRASLELVLVVAVACGGRHEGRPVGDGGSDAGGDGDADGGGDGGDGGGGDAEPFDCGLCGPGETCNPTDRTCETDCGSYDCLCNGRGVTCADGTYTRCVSHLFSEGCRDGSECQWGVFVRTCEEGCAPTEGAVPVCAEDPEECRTWPETRPTVTIAVPAQDPVGCERLGSHEPEVSVDARGPVVARDEGRFSVDDPALGEVEVLHDLPAGSTDAVEVGREVELHAVFRPRAGRDCAFTLVVSDEEAPILVAFDGGAYLELDAPVPLFAHLAEAGCPSWPGLCADETTLGLSVALGDADPVLVRQGRREELAALGRIYGVHDLRSYERSAYVDVVEDCYDALSVPTLGFVVAEGR